MFFQKDRTVAKPSKFTSLRIHLEKVPNLSSTRPINNRLISTTDKFQKFSRKSSDHLARRLSWGSLEWAQPSPTPRKFMNEETAWIAAEEA